MPVTVATKPYDWTYTTVYTGHESRDDEETSNSMRFVPAEAENPAHTIPLAELTRPDPILFYAEIPLFEDELHDNGSSHLLVRIVSHFNSIQSTFVVFKHILPIFSALCQDAYSSSPGSLSASTTSSFEHLTRGYTTLLRALLHWL